MSLNIPRKPTHSDDTPSDNTMHDSLLSDLTMHRVKTQDVLDEDNKISLSGANRLKGLVAMAHEGMGLKQDTAQEQEEQIPMDHKPRASNVFEATTKDK